MYQSLGILIERKCTRHHKPSEIKEKIVIVIEHRCYIISLKNQTGLAGATHAAAERYVMPYNAMERVMRTKMTT